jgi:hypothetical protein
VIERSGTHPGGKPIPGKGGKGGWPGMRPGGGGAPGKKGGGTGRPGTSVTGGGMGAATGGTAYAVGGAPYTPPVLESAEGPAGDVGDPEAVGSLAPMRALCASSWARSSSSVRTRFSTFGRFAWGWEIEPAARPSSISLRRL